MVSYVTTLIQTHMLINKQMLLLLRQQLVSLNEPLPIPLLIQGIDGYITYQDLNQKYFSFKEPCDEKIGCFVIQPDFFKHIIFNTKDNIKVKVTFDTIEVIVDDEINTELAKLVYVKTDQLINSIDNVSNVAVKTATTDKIFVYYVTQLLDTVTTLKGLSTSSASFANQLHLSHVGDDLYLQILTVSCFVSIKVNDCVRTDNKLNFFLHSDCFYRIPKMVDLFVDVSKNSGFKMGLNISTIFDKTIFSFINDQIEYRFIYDNVVGTLGNTVVSKLLTQEYKNVYTIPFNKMINILSLKRTQKLNGLGVVTVLDNTANCAMYTVNYKDEQVITDKLTVVSHYCEVIEPTEDSSGKHVLCIPNQLLTVFNTLTTKRDIRAILTFKYGDVSLDENGTSIYGVIRWEQYAIGFITNQLWSNMMYAPYCFGNTPAYKYSTVLSKLRIDLLTKLKDDQNLYFSHQISY